MYHAEPIIADLAFRDRARRCPDDQAFYEAHGPVVRHALSSALAAVGAAIRESGKEVLHHLHVGARPHATR